MRQEKRRIATQGINLNPKPLRPVSDEQVRGLAVSMERLGLMTPITVRYHEHVRSSDGETGDSYELIAGRHRLTAAQSLGWEAIDAVVIECSDVDARLWEISENLHRSDLTALQRDDQVAEWIRLTAEKVDDNLSQTPTKGGRPGKIAAAADEIGVNKRDAQRAVKVASLSPEAKAAAVKHGLDDNRSALLEAAREDEPAAQVAKIEERAGKPKPKPMETAGADTDADDDEDDEDDDDSFFVSSDVPGAAETNKLIGKVIGFFESIDRRFAAWIDGDPDDDSIRAMGAVLFAYAKDLDRRAFKIVKQRRRENDKAYKDYSKRFGSLGLFVFDRDNVRLVQKSLASGVDQFEERKQRDKEHAEQYDRDQEVFQRTPITAETEQHYTALIKHRGLYEGACSLAWPMYFQFREEHPDLPPLTDDDRAYAGMWTSCALPATAEH